MRGGWGDRAERGRAGGATVGRQTLHARVRPGLIGLIVLPAVAAASAADAGELDVWRFQCITEGVEEVEEEAAKTEQVCTTELVTSAGARDFVVYFVHNRNGRAPLVVSGDDQKFAETVIKVDKKKPLGADHCEMGLCYYGLEKSAVLLKQFKRGGKARVTISVESSTVILDKVITLRGFSAAFAKFGS